MATSVDGNTIERVFVDSNAVTRVKVDGTQAWPLAYTKMTAASQSFTGNTQYGYAATTSPSYGSIAEDTTIKSVSIDAIRWIDFDSGTDVLDVSVGSSVQQDHFEVLVIETDQGVQKFYTSQIDNSFTGTQWQWNLATKPFTASTVYEAWFVGDG